MKFLGSQFAYLIADRETRSGIGALAKYLTFLVAMVAVYAIVFHLIKLHVEHEQHSWVTGLYWTLVVMSTLGFGDITFTSDVGRLFSIVVLLSGVVFLLVMLPFLFIRLFYAPWLEARVRLRAPRQVPEGTSGHLVVTEYDDIAAALVERLRAEGVPYFVIEGDPAVAARLAGEGVSVIAGENDSRHTYERLLVTRARLLFANCADTTNTNITLTAREVAPDVPITAVAEEEDSVDILQLTGATTVLPLKQQLGEYLASRVHAGRAEAHVIGAHGDLQIAEVPARDTPFAGLTVRETRLRERTGLSIAGFWQRGMLRPAAPTERIDPDCVLVVAGTAENIASLDALLPKQTETPPPVLVVGAGRVGFAAARALTRKGLRVHAIDREAAPLASLAAVSEAVFAGEAADRQLLERAGIAQAPSVLLTTNDDAMNIYLTVYCRRLKPALRIVSRVTHERNVEAIHRAGADFVLSYTTLGVEAVMSIFRGHPPVLLGEGVELFSVTVPRALAGLELRDTGIGSKTGMSVVGLKVSGAIQTRLTSETVLPDQATLLLLGSYEQRQAFTEAFDGD